MIDHMEPGRYRTRNGKIAIVAQHRPSWVLPWHGAIEGCADCWGSNGEYTPGREPHCKDLMARLADDPDDRIERALHVLREASRYDTTEGYSVTETTVIDEAMQILEGEIDD
jgi:myo-inositol catabolism protein IolC